jgi:hypothetical protein
MDRCPGADPLVRGTDGTGDPACFGASGMIWILTDETDRIDSNDTVRGLGVCRDTLQRFLHSFLPLHRCHQSRYETGHVYKA